MNPSREPHVLVVENHAPNATLVCDLLRFHGFRVSWAEDGVVGRTIVGWDRSDLIPMDPQMPRLDGYALTSELKGDRATAKIPIIALTACAMVGDAERACAAGCDSYLTKPIDTRALPQTVRRFLRHEA